MYAEVCFMSFFEGTARVEFIDVVAMIIVLVYRQISYAIVSWSVFFGVLYDDTHDVESRCFLKCTKLARLYYFIRPTTKNKNKQDSWQLHGVTIIAYNLLKWKINAR